MRELCLRVNHANLHSMVEKLQKALDRVDFHLGKDQDGLLPGHLDHVEDEI